MMKTPWMATLAWLAATALAVLLAVLATTDASVELRTLPFAAPLTGG